MRARWVQHDRSMELPVGAKTIVATWWPGLYYLVSTAGQQRAPALAKLTEQVSEAEAKPQNPYVTEVFRCHKDGFPKSLAYRYYRREYESLEQAKVGHAVVLEKLAGGQLKLKRTVKAARNTQRMWGRRKVDETRSKTIRNPLDSVLGLDPSGPARKPDASRNPDLCQAGRGASFVSAPVALAGNDAPSMEQEPHIPATGRAISADNELSHGDLDRQQSPACSIESLRPTILNPEGTPCDDASAQVFEPGGSNGSGLQIQADINRIDARSATIRAALDSFNKKAEATFQKRLDSFAAAGEIFSSAQPDLLSSPAKHAEASRLSAEVLSPGKEIPFTDLSQQCEQVLETQSKLFEERLARLAEKSFSQAQANAHRIVSRLEAYLAQAEETKSSIDASLTNLSRKSREAADAQTDILEANLAKIADQIASRMDAVLGPVTSRIDSYRAQVAGMNSTLELALTGFTQRTQETVQIQARLFEGQMTRISEQTIAQAQECLRSEIMQLGAATAHSLEGQITSLVERVQHSLSETETLLARVEGSRLQYDVEVEQAQRNIRELSQNEIESTIEALKDKTAKEVEALAVNVSQEIRDRFHSEATATINEFIDRECRTRVQEAVRDSYEKSEQELIAKLHKLYSERQQLTIDQLETTSRELGAELVRHIQKRADEHVEQAVNALKDRLLTQAAQLKESGERLGQSIEAGLQEHLQTWSNTQLESVQQQAGNVFADFLRCTRAESEAAAQNLRERLNSDMEQLETKVAENIQGKLRRVNEEFRSIVEGVFA